MTFHESKLEVVFMMNRYEICKTHFNCCPKFKGVAPICWA